MKMTENSENYAGVLYGPRDLRIVKWPMPVINDDEVLVEMSCVGICGSDVKFYDTGSCGYQKLKEPTVIGHEGSGYVVQVGANVTSLKIGDRVAIEPTNPCRACEHCKRGRYNVCARPRYCSSDAPGNLSRYYAHVADFCHKIPSNMSMEEGAGVQPLAIAVHACSRAGVRLGARALVLGAGPVGVLCALTARAMGATDIVITDVVESRLERAKQMGAGDTILIKPEYSDQDVVDKIEQTLGAQPDVTFDACGQASAQRVAMMVTKTGGVMMIIGIGQEMVEVPLMSAMLREVDIRGSYRIANTYPAALAAVSSGAVELKRFISHHFPLQQSTQALHAAASGVAMKVIIHLKDYTPFYCFTY